MKRLLQNKGSHSKRIDMTQGEPLGILVVFAVPMILSNLLQQMYNVIDSAIVGRQLGMQALAAVGNAGTITAVLVQLATGFAVGCSIVVSQFFGANKKEYIVSCATTMSVFVSAAAAVFTILLWILGNPILQLVQTPEEVVGFASVYLKIYAAGCIPSFLYNVCSAVYTALGDSATPLRFLAISSAINVVLDVAFLLIFHWGVAGAAWATVLSQFVSMVLAFKDMPGLFQGMGRAEDFRFFDWELLKTMLRYAVPAAVQQSIVSIGSVAVQATVNSFGTTVMAACAAATRIVNLASVVAINFSNAYSNFVGQNIGAGNIGRIAEGLKASFLCCGLISGVMTLLMECFAEPLAQIFLSGADSAQAVAIGAQYIRTVGAFLILFALYMLVKAVFKGSGDMSWFLFVTLLSFFIRLLLTVGLSHAVGIWMIWWSIGIGWAIAFLFSIGRYFQGGWKEKKVVIK